MKTVQKPFMGVLAVILLGCPADPVDPDPDPDPTLEVDAELAGENEVPPVATPATGQVEAWLEDDTLHLTGSFDGMTSPLTEIAGSSAHIHEGGADEVGPVVVNIDVDPGDDDLSGDLSLTVELDEDQIEAFENEDYYVNIHTENYPAGELRAQLAEDTPTFAAVVWDFQDFLVPEDHVHDVETDATGFATGILREDDAFVLSGAFTDLSSPLHEIEGSAAHVHLGFAGETGDIVFNVEIEEDEGDGTFHVTRTLTGDEVDWLLEGQLYLNIHTDDHPQGELRVQLPGDHE